jgi:tetrachlorobenzoquinone reductase
LMQCTTISVILSTVMQAVPFISVLIRQLRLEGDGIVSVELESCDDGKLPAYDAGAHIEVRVPGAGPRNYSLVSDLGAGDTYRIGVKRESEGRGGSRWFHEQARVGDRLEIGPPRNAFPLNDQAENSVFIAGGIGITPLLSMVGRLVELGRPWELHVTARTPRSLPFQSLLAHYAKVPNGAVRVHFSNDAPGRLDFQSIVRSAQPDTHVYCCGPSGMIDAFVHAARDRAADTVHFERFAAGQAAATDGGFQLQLARDGRCLNVPAGKSILDTLLDAGVDIPYSCTQGVCGSCRIAVLEGEPDHRDDYLSDDERAANDSLIPCCSGSRSQRLVVDL